MASSHVPVPTCTPTRLFPREGLQIDSDYLLPPLLVLHESTEEGKREKEREETEKLAKSDGKTKEGGDKRTRGKSGEWNEGGARAPRHSMETKGRN